MPRCCPVFLTYAYSLRSIRLSSKNSNTAKSRSSSFILSPFPLAPRTRRARASNRLSHQAFFPTIQILAFSAWPHRASAPQNPITPSRTTGRGAFRTFHILPQSPQRIGDPNLGFSPPASSRPHLGEPRPVTRFLQSYIVSSKARQDMPSHINIHSTTPRQGRLASQPVMRSGLRHHLNRV